MIQKNRGFTTIELLVTLFVAMTFVGAFAQIFTVIDRGAAEARWQSAASNLAYSNLRRYAKKSDVGAFICNSDTNLASNASAPGQMIHEYGYGGGTDGIPGTSDGFIYIEVRAYAPAGCGTDTPIKLIATTTYSSNPTRKAVHATYVN
jgi:type II secretory pathway pseudopilin PulG